MAQITIYLPDETELQARRAAKSARKSVSQWIAERIRKDLSEQWPQAVLDAAGALPDFPTVKQLRRGYGKDSPREKLS